MFKPIIEGEGVFRKAMMLARISRVMSTEYLYSSLVAEALRAIAQGCGATLTDQATLKPSIAHAARVTLQDRALCAAVLNAVAGEPSDAVRLFESGTMALRGTTWEMQSIGRAMLVLGEIAFAAITNPSEAVTSARDAAYQGDQGGELRSVIDKERQAFECSLVLLLSGSNDALPLRDAVRHSPPPSQQAEALLFPLV